MRVRYIPFLFCALITTVLTSADETETNTSTFPRDLPELRVAVAVDDDVIKICQFVVPMDTYVTSGVMVEMKEGTIGPPTEAVPSIMTFCTYIDATAIIARRIDGRAVPVKDLMAELAKPTPVIFVNQGLRVDPLFSTMFKPDSLVLSTTSQIIAPTSTTPQTAVPSISTTSSNHDGSLSVPTGGPVSKLPLPVPAAVPPIPAGRQVKVSTTEELLKAVNNAKNGDVILLAPGTYNLNEEISPGPNKGTVVLYGDPQYPQNVKIRIHGEFGTIRADEGSHLRLFGLDISNELFCGVWATSNSMVDVLFCIIHDCGNGEMDGIQVLGTLDGPQTYVLVKNSVISSNDKGIIAAGQLDVNNCLIKNNKSNGVFVLAGDGKKSLTGCTITHNGNDGVWIIGYGSFATITDCNIHDNKGNGILVSNLAGGEFFNNILSGNKLENWLIHPNCKVTRTGNTPNE